MESVRAATTDDLPVVSALVDEFVSEQRTLRGGAVWESFEGPRLHPEHLATAIADVRSPHRRQHVLLGCLDDQAVGRAYVTIETVATGDDLAVIRVIHVQEEAREVGVGSALLDAVFEVARSSGCTGVDATVLPGNRSAKNFFEMHGLVARAISVHRAVGEGS